MKSMRKTSVLFGLLLLAAGSAGAGTIEARVPFPFMVGHQVLPAGQYRVERNEYDASILVIRGEHGARASVITPSIQADGQDPAGQQPSLVFTHGEAGYRLKDVWTSPGNGREILAK